MKLPRLKPYQIALEAVCFLLLLAGLVFVVIKYPGLPAKIPNHFDGAGNVTTTGIAATMAHIHIGKAGTNGPVVITLTKMGDNGWMVPEGSKLSDAQYQAYKAGELYVNVHSAEHKPGEIRGQIMQPRPASAGYSY